MVFIIDRKYDCSPKNLCVPILKCVTISMKGRRCAVCRQRSTTKQIDLVRPLTLIEFQAVKAIKKGASNGRWTDRLVL